jgi:hypothetical protein
MKTQLAALALSLSILAAPASATIFSNPAPITIVDGGETTSSIAVSGLSGTITSLSLTLTGLSHTYPDDLVFGLLNEDLGIGFVFFSGAGGSTDISNVNLTFSDFAGGPLPESFVGGQILSGTYLPSNYGDYEFTFFDNVTSFAGFNTLTGNGTWTLYVDDVFPEDGGTVAGGWSLDIVTSAGGVPEPATWAMMIGGFGLAGTAIRRRRSTTAVVTA